MPKPTDRNSATWLLLSAKCTMPLNISLKCNQKKKEFTGLLPKLHYKYWSPKSKFHIKKVKNLELFIEMLFSSIIPLWKWVSNFLSIFQIYYPKYAPFSCKWHIIVKLLANTFWYSLKKFDFYFLYIRRSYWNFLV